MSILIAPADNRGWGGRRRGRLSMRGVGPRRLTLRRLLGLGTTTTTTTRRTRSRRISRAPATRTTLVAVRTRRRRR